MKPSHFSWRAILWVRLCNANSDDGPWQVTESSLEKGVNRLHLKFFTKNFEICQIKVALVQTGSVDFDYNWTSLNLLNLD
jgi:hypothetical protein